MMDLFSRRQWKKWAYGKLHASRPAPNGRGKIERGSDRMMRIDTHRQARMLDETPHESEYPGWLLPGLLAASGVLMLIYAFLLR